MFLPQRQSRTTKECGREQLPHFSAGSKVRQACLLLVVAANFSKVQHIHPSILNQINVDRRRECNNDRCGPRPNLQLCGLFAACQQPYHIREHA